jgi:hypothetical protein
VDLNFNWAVASPAKSRKPRGRLLSLGLSKKRTEINQGHPVFIMLKYHIPGTERAYPVPCQTSSCHFVFITTRYHQSCVLTLHFRWRN